MFSKIKITGHPVHPMLTPFPIVFFTTTLASFIIFDFTHDVFWYRAAVTANIAGCAMWGITAVPGILDWISIPRGKTNYKVLKHALSNAMAFIVFSLNAILFGMRWQMHLTYTFAPVLLSSIGMVFTVIAGFFGWEIVQRHHVGVDLKPDQEELEEENSDLAELDRRATY